MACVSWGGSTTVTTTTTNDDNNNDDDDNDSNDNNNYYYTYTTNDNDNDKTRISEAQTTQYANSRYTVDYLKHKFKVQSEAYKPGRIKRGCSQKPDLQIGGKKPAPDIFRTQGSEAQTTQNANSRYTVICYTLSQCFVWITILLFNQLAEFWVAYFRVVYFPANTL